MKIKVTFKTGQEAYIRAYIDGSDDWEYSENKNATDFTSLTIACMFCSQYFDEVTSSFFSDDNEISKIEFVE